MKKVIAACYDQVLLFDSSEEFDIYEEGLKARKLTYAVTQIEHLDNGQCMVRIKKQYNNTKFLGGEEL